MLSIARRLAISAGFAACAGLVACSSSSTPSPGSPTDASTQTDSTTATPSDADVVSCDNEPGLDTYVANLTKTGEAGTSFVLVAGDPAPPQRGMNTWTLHVSDASGKPMAGAKLDVKPFMPQHGHGSSQTPVITESGGGDYAIGNLYLFMPGLWTITVSTLTVDADAGTSVTGDSAVFTFCIDG